MLFAAGLLIVYLGLVPSNTLSSVSTSLYKCLKLVAPSFCTELALHTDMYLFSIELRLASIITKPVFVSLNNKKSFLCSAKVKKNADIMFSSSCISLSTTCLTCGFVLLILFKRTSISAKFSLPANPFCISA